MTTSSTHCLICNGSCISNRNSIQIFNKEPTGDNELTLLSSLPTVLSKLLEKNITEDGVHSQLLCKKCYKLVDEYDELQGRINEIKDGLFSSYSSTLEKRTNPTYSGHADTEEETTKVGQEVPKKILDIPSSDEESAQTTDKSSLHGMADIEMALVKIHNGTDSDHDMEGDTNSQSFNFGGHSDDEYEVPGSAGGDLLVQAAEVAEKNIMNVNIKVEPNSDESVPPPVSTPDNKPNILKKRKIMSTSESAMVENIMSAHLSDDARKEQELSVPVVSRDQDIYTCLMCMGDETVAGAAKAIIVHMKQAHETRLYICDVCGQDFRKRNLLSAHLDEHVAAEDGDFQCEVCNRIFSNLRLFRIHRRMHYPQNKAWSCDTCGKRYSSKNLLDEHVNTHLGVRPYVCSTCGKDFASKYTFKAHEKTHEIRPRPYKCEKCQKSFLSAQNLAQHEKTHLGMKEFTCHLCNKQFSSAHNLEVHSIVHSGYKPFVCGLCGKAFARKAEIRDHERTHTGERPYQCEFCGATFSQRSNLQSHKRATHYDDKRYQCVDCGKGFKRRRLLDYHVKAAHTGERPYKCETCDATFVYPEHFKKHRRIHTGEKPYLCEVCGKAFNSRDNRNAHRFVHSDKKPYECLVCGAGFMRKPLLYQHMQTQGHLNDTIVVNQPRLTTDDEHIVTVNAAGEMEFIDTSSVGDSKLYITGEDGSEHIIIDGQQINFADAGSDDEQQPETMDEIEQIVTGSNDEFEEIIGSDALASGETQIIETPDGPIQLVKVKIPNDNGEEEEAWIKIVSE